MLAVVMNTPALITHRSRRALSRLCLLVLLLIPTVAPVSAQVAEEQSPEPSSPEPPSGAPNDEEPAGEPGQDGDELPEVEVVKARLKGSPGHRDVRSIERFRRGGGRVDWSPQGDWIAIDERGPDGRYDIHLIKADGAQETCLTCELYELRKISALNPAWHPSGEYLVFHGQNAARKLDLSAVELADPFRGLHSELWVVTRDGRHAWQITQVRENGGAVIDPHLSFEADQLVWSERLTNRSRPWGEWGVRVAALEIKRGLPRLGKVRTFEPGGKQFLYASGFTPNDRGLLIAASPDPGQGVEGLDILELDLESERFERLTATPDSRDELALYAPKGHRIVWVSDRNLDPPEGGARLPRRSDLWVASRPDTRGEPVAHERLTYFNEPASKHTLGQALIDDLSWSPQGDRLMVHVLSSDGGEVEEAVYLILLDASYRR